MNCIKCKHPIPTGTDELDEDCDVCGVGPYCPACVIPSVHNCPDSNDESEDNFLDEDDDDWDEDFDDDFEDDDREDEDENEEDDEDEYDN